MSKSKSTRYDLLFYLVIIPLFGLGVYYANYVFILIGFVLAIPLNYLIYKEFRKEGKEKAFFKNKLRALGVGLIFVLLILANSKYGFF
jgi:4-hydroxybenzoate polyprenyltransferase